MTPTIIKFVNIIPMQPNLQLIVAVYSIIILIVNDIFVKIAIAVVKFKYVLTTSLVKYSTFGIYMMFLLINCVIETKC